jgi:RNA polymerase sigma factor (sigma-70 family)
VRELRTIRSEKFNESCYNRVVSEPHATSIAVEHYLHDLAELQGDYAAEPVVRALLSRSVDRLHMLCSTMLFQHYPRLTRPPLNLRADELLSAVVERLIKALRDARPTNVRHFFALANQHMRWELNDLARRLDHQARSVELAESMAAAPPDSSDSQLTPNAGRILAAIEGLPEDAREVFSMVRIQGMSQKEAANILGVSAKTIQRRLNRGLALLATELGDLKSRPN